MTVIEKDVGSVEITAATKSFIAKSNGLEITFVIQVDEGENEINRISPALTQLAFDKSPVKITIIPCDNDIFKQRLGAGQASAPHQRVDDDE